MSAGRKGIKAVCVAKVARASGESTAGSFSLEEGMSPERPQGPLCLGTVHEVGDREKTEGMAHQEFSCRLSLSSVSFFSQVRT